MVRRALRNPDPQSSFEQARKALALSGTWAHTEFLQQASLRFAGGDPKFLERLLVWPRAVNRGATESYGYWDTTTKLNAFEDEIAKGRPVNIAARIAQQVGLDYSKIPVPAKKLARGWYPFVKFPVALIQQTIPLAAKNPTRAWLLLKSPRLYSSYKARQDRVDLEALWAVAPDWWDRGLMVYLGKDNDGAPLLANASQFVVWNDLAEAARALAGTRTQPGGLWGGAKEIAGRLQPGGPVPGTIFRELTGISEAVRPLVGPGLPAETEAARRWQRVGEAWAPPAFQVARTATTSAGPTVEKPYMREPHQEYWRLGGVLVYRADIGALYEWKMKRLSQEASKLERLAVGVGSEFADMSPAQKQREMAAAKKQLTEAQKEIAKLTALERAGKIPTAIPLPSRGEVGTLR
jgi:hypothetical protein